MMQSHSGQVTFTTATPYGTLAMTLSQKGGSLSGTVLGATDTVEGLWILVSAEDSRVAPGSLTGAVIGEGRVAGTLRGSVLTLGDYIECIGTSHPWTLTRLSSQQ